MTITSITRENWLNSAAAILIDEVVRPALKSTDIPSIRYSITAPPTKQRKYMVLGECWNRAASSDNTNEIFITAQMGRDDSEAILSTVLHEIIHAILNNEHGHRGKFVTLCKLIGLQGTQQGAVKETFTSTTPTPPLQAAIEEIIEDLGPIPHGKMNTALSGKPKQKNRQLLVQCNACDFKFRASSTMIAKIIHTECLACNDGTLSPKV